MEYGLCMSYEVIIFLCSNPACPATPATGAVANMPLTTQAIDIKPCNRAAVEEYYTEKEIDAVRLILKKMLKRRRWMQLIDEARSDSFNTTKTTTKTSSWLERSLPNSKGMKLIESNGIAMGRATAGHVYGGWGCRGGCKEHPGRTSSRKVGTRTAAEPPSKGGDAWSC